MSESLITDRWVSQEDLRGKVEAWRFGKQGTRSLPLGKRTYSMGILNVTPDSFSDGGEHYGLEKAMAHYERMKKDQVDVIDLGGESTRPGSTYVSEEEEMRRIIPVIQAIRAKDPDIVLSVDTYKAPVAEAALEAGADIINDIYALFADPDMGEVVAKHGAGVILMNHPAYYRPHLKRSQVFGDRPWVHPFPADLVEKMEKMDILEAQCAFLNMAIQKCRSLGIPYDHICIDPGLGFGMTTVENLKLIRCLDQLVASGLPILLAPSRKRFIKEILGQEAETVEIGTASIVAYGVKEGVDLVRIHDLDIQLPALRMANFILHGDEMAQDLTQIKQHGSTQIIQ